MESIIIVLAFYYEFGETENTTVNGSTFTCLGSSTLVLSKDGSSCGRFCGSHGPRGGHSFRGGSLDNGRSTRQGDKKCDHYGDTN
jgi:hypothetical protein